jgi:alcohol dehydrogenase (cytochrome c)
MRLAGVVAGLLWGLLAGAQDLPRYEIHRAVSPISIDGNLDEPAWQQAAPAGDFRFHWWTHGLREQTVARMVWDDENLYVGWQCQDRHISGYVTQRHGPVSRDDCVEIFLSPNPAKIKNYYTFEINVLGAMLNRARTDWWTGPPTWEPEGVRYRTSHHGLARKDESPEDQQWTVELAIPFRNFARDAAHTPPRPGDQWRLNLNRTGGKTNAQSSSWSPIPADKRSFHTPEAFGWVSFVNEPPPSAAGREIYNRACTMCHGMNGAAGDRAPALVSRRRYLRSTEADLTDAIRNGIPGTLMPASTMPDEDVRKIVAYIRSLRASLPSMRRDSRRDTAWPAGLEPPRVTDADLLKPDPRNWLSYSGAYHSQRHSALREIDKTNVRALAPKWIYAVPGAERLETVPLVANGVMYLTQPNQVYAIDARTGRLIWEYRRQPALRRGPNRGVAIYGDKVYFGTPDAQLVALDARTGELAWEAKLADADEGYWSPVAPLPVRGKIIMGIAPGDHGLNGFLDAYDAETGRRLWRWNTIPKPGEPGSETWAGDSWKTGGGATWLTGSYDPGLNLIYWGIGNPAPDFNGDARKGDNLYTESMVALDADTGKLKWHFQFTPHDVHDWDGVEIPVLVDAPFKGRPRKLLAQANRNGFYYVLDRASGEFLHAAPFVKLLNWATGLTPQGRPIRVPGVDPSFQGSKVCPATSGATNWMSPAYNPDSGLFYVVAQEGCGINTKATDTFRPGGHPFMGTGYIESPEEPWQMYVRALDYTTGKLRWEYKQPGARGYGAGLLSTAGGVLFAGDAQGIFTALDAATGALLWSFNTGRQITASPISYSVDGRQYVTIAAGSNIVTFGLYNGRDTSSDQ